MFCKNKDIEDLSKLLHKVPRVVFENLPLQFAIGQWLEVLPTTIVTNILGIKRSKSFDYKALMKSGKIGSSELLRVCIAFGWIFKKMGIPNSEICVLDNFDENNFSFDCKLLKASETLSMSIRWGDFFDFAPELTVETEDYKKTYEYYNDKNKSYVNFELIYYTLKNKGNNNTCSRYYSDSGAHFLLENGNLRLSITICKPYSIFLKEKLKGKFKVKNEEEFQQYLLNLSFPVAIEEVYKKFNDMCLDSDMLYPRLEIKAEKQDKHKLITDLVSLKDGEMENFKLTRSGKSISIDKNGNWSYESDSVSLDNLNELVMKFDFSINEDENSCQVLVDNNEFKQIDKEIGNIPSEVNKVKKIAKNMINA